MNTKLPLWLILIIAVVVFLLLKRCEKEPRIVTKTETIETIVRDTFIKEKTVIKKIKDPVYVERIKTIKGKDSIVYKDKPSETTIEANKYETTLESNKATAKLQITTTGELLDVSGAITYPEKETTTTITKIKDKSGLYIYGSVPLNNFSSPELGLMFQVRNQFGIMGGVQYNSLSNKPDFKVGILIKI